MGVRKNPPVPYEEYYGHPKPEKKKKRIKYETGIKGYQT